MAKSFNIQMGALLRYIDRHLCPECKKRIAAQVNLGRQGSTLGEALSNESHNLLKKSG